jgi:hypothetical protein
MITSLSKKKRGFECLIIYAYLYINLANTAKIVKIYSLCGLPRELKFTCVHYLISVTDKLYSLFKIRLHCKYNYNEKLKASKIKYTQYYQIIMMMTHR